MIQEIISAVPYEVITSIGINNMWKTIYNVSCSSKSNNTIIKEKLVEKYIDVIKNNIKNNNGRNDYILPSSVVQKVYPSNITVAYCKYSY